MDNSHPLASSRRESDLEYQSFKLNKEFIVRSIDNKPFDALKRANGLECIYPDTRIQISLIEELMQPDSCEILIVVAMYNEGPELFTNTMIGVNENLEYFNNARVDPNKIACIVICDGVKAFTSRDEKEKPFFKDYFDDETVKKRFGVNNLLDCKLPRPNKNNQDEFMHCFAQRRTFGTCVIPLNIIFCVKQQNKRKLNTHLWFFGGFCYEMKPKYVILLDVGTRPLPGSLFYLYEAMECNENVAGCCGEIKPMKPNFWKIVVPAQVVEYKFAHMLDKALESLIGFITVLPGAFSAYRWDALSLGTNPQDPDSIQGSPLWEDYFKSICHPDEMDAFHSNIYLAEDRVLCLALFTKKDKAYILRYVKKSIAETDVPDSIAVLMSQRRRWINGSWFALIDSLKKCKRIFHSSHNCCRKFVFMLQMFYYFVNVIYSWFLVGGFCLAVNIALHLQFSSVGSSDNVSRVGDALFLFYISILIMLFIISLAVKPHRVEDLYKTIVAILSLYQLYIIGIVIWFLLAGGTTLAAAGIGFTALGFVLIVIINNEILTITSGCIYYVMLIPTYVNIFLIYSICNVHDCTWGNRPDMLNDDEKQRLEEFEEFRARWVIIWTFCNTLFSYVMTSVNSGSSSNAYFYFLVISSVGMVILMIRVIGGIIYAFIEPCKKTLVIDDSLPFPSRKNNRRESTTGGLRALKNIAKPIEIKQDPEEEYKEDNELRDSNKSQEKPKAHPIVANANVKISEHSIESNSISEVNKSHEILLSGHRSHSKSPKSQKSSSSSSSSSEKTD